MTKTSNYGKLATLCYYLSLLWLIYIVFHEIYTVRTIFYAGEETKFYICETLVSFNNGLQIPMVAKLMVVFVSLLNIFEYLLLVFLFKTIKRDLEINDCSIKILIKLGIVHVLTILPIYIFGITAGELISNNMQLLNGEVKFFYSYMPNFEFVIDGVGIILIGKFLKEVLRYKKENELTI